MAKIMQQKCPNCGGAPKFDPETGKLVCPYCGTVFEIIPDEKRPEEAPEAAEPETAEPETPASSDIEGFDFDGLNEQAQDENAGALPVYNCVSCGAEVIATAEQAALTCPYCGNNIVLTDKVSGKLRPDRVVPFKISSKELPAAVTRFYKDKVLLPRRFFSESTMGKVTGIYVPFWVFNGKLTGDMNFNAQATSQHRDGNYIVHDTKHYALERGVNMEFENVPVDASKKIDDALTDSIQPFDMSEAKPFDTRYLAGFTADRFDQARDDIAVKAKQLMLTTAEKIVRGNEAGYSSVAGTGSSLKADLKALYMLLPVYMFSIEYGGKKYSYAVNGQTGKVVGEVPTDKGVSRAYFLKRMLPVVAAVLLFMFIKYMTGR